MASPKTTPVIIDTDPGVDDTIAILLALASPELEILAIIVSFGNTDVESSHLNILKTYQALTAHFAQNPSHRDRFPNFSPVVKTILARGSGGPLEGDLHSARYFHGRDGLGGITERHPDLDVKSKELPEDHQLVMADESGVDIALDFIRKNPSRAITYISLGPLTNLAHMMRQDGNLVRDRIGRIICMGGALDVPGNTSPMAEFNFFADPFAVKELLASDRGLPFDRFIMLPLDITTPHELPFPLYKLKVDQGFNSSAIPSVAIQKSPLVHFTSSFLERTREIMLQFGKDAMELHDVVAVWCAIENPPAAGFNLAPGWNGKSRIFDIERFGEITRGMLVVDRRVDESAYAPGANRAAVQLDLDKTTLKTSFSAQVEANGPTITKSSVVRSVFCVTETPGPGSLLQLLLRRVWGTDYL